MPRRNRTILDDIALLPWWINVILAIVVYLAFRYWIPSVDFQSPLFEGISMGLRSIAPIAGGLILFIAAISAFNAWRKGNMLEQQTGIETIRKISWREFEELVGESYKRKGFKVTETGGGGADGGVDLVIKKGGETLLIQCKHWKMNKVGVKVVRELYGVVAAEGSTGGIVISSGAFTQEAINFAKGKPLELIDGSGLLKLVAEVQESPNIAGQDLDNICPICGSEMVLRTAKKGQNAGQQFWGCSAFPKCRSTKPYRCTLE